MIREVKALLPWKEEGRQEMLREEAAPDAQRKESLLLWMEGEQGEDQNTGSGGGPDGTGWESLCSERAHPWEIGRLWHPLGPECRFGATVHRVRTRAFVCISLESRAFALLFFRQTLRQVAN